MPDKITILNSKDGYFPNFEWAEFYQKFADKLLTYRGNRPGLLSKIHEIASNTPNLDYLTDRDSKQNIIPLVDICPFTVFGTFNRRLRDENRKNIMKEFAETFGIKNAIPKKFDGIPVLHPQKSMYFGFQNDRQSSDIQNLWNLFQLAIKLADSNGKNHQSQFIKMYDRCLSQKHTGWKLSMGLYWIRPFYFLSLDGNSQEFIEKTIGMSINKSGSNKRCSANDYLDTRDDIIKKFKRDSIEKGLFQKLSYVSRFPKRFKSDNKIKSSGDSEKKSGDLNSPYTVENIATSDCFVKQSKIQEIFDRFLTEKNIILQGPPGTGKSWLGRRLAFAVVGFEDNKRVRVIQFHPNYSYEDFVRGWRPDPNKRLTLKDGILIKMIEEAKLNPKSKFVLIIEEINRGSPARIFGDMLTILDPDKRNPSESIILSYNESDGTDIERVYIPENLFILGTMNVADRSLALVDYALRRRFSFFDMHPEMNDRWLSWVSDEFEIDAKFLKLVRDRINNLNNKITSELGPQFQIGHSFVTPTSIEQLKNGANDWYRQIVNTKIEPLLREYWYDDSPDKVADVKKSLLEEI